VLRHQATEQTEYGPGNHYAVQVVLVVEDLTVSVVTVVSVRTGAAAEEGVQELLQALVVVAAMVY
jgi:hypothetical protein